MSNGGDGSQMTYGTKTGRHKNRNNNKDIFENAHLI